MRVSVGAGARQLGGAVHMSLNEVPAEATVRPQRALQIYWATGRQTTECGQSHGFRPQVGEHRLGVHGDDRQTHAIDREAVSRAHLRGQRRANAQPNTAIGDRRVLHVTN